VALARPPSPRHKNGYVTNLPAAVMPAAEVIVKYHESWHVERSSGCRRPTWMPGPMFNRVREAIEAHLTIVFTALAVSHAIQGSTGFAIAQ
jgi:hypothetical protein